MADQVKHAAKAIDRLRKPILAQMEDVPFCDLDGLKTQMKIWDALEETICKKFHVSIDEVNLYEITSDQIHENKKSSD
jgi:hypothetical protein